MTMQTLHRCNDGVVMRLLAVSLRSSRFSHHQRRTVAAGSSTARTRRCSSTSSGFRSTHCSLPHPLFSSLSSSCVPRSPPSALPRISHLSHPHSPPSSVPLRPLSYLSHPHSPLSPSVPLRPLSHLSHPHSPLSPSVLPPLSHLSHPHSPLLPPSFLLFPISVISHRCSSPSPGTIRSSRSVAATCSSSTRRPPTS